VRKHRSLLIGLGVGLMLGASMLELIDTARSVASPPAAEPSPLSEEQLAQAAKDHGYQLVAADRKWYTEDEVEKRVNEALATAKAAENGEAGSAGGASAAKPLPDPHPSPAPERHTLKVEYKMSLTAVANQLYKMGLIDSVSKFVQYAKPYSGMLQVGTCEFVGKPTYEAIVQELIRSKR
jgi:pyruvate/2-oxoglutarate dehydrogenase complex dihydrolipoamide acyltransferase (E2) component